MTNKKEEHEAVELVKGKGRLAEETIDYFKRVEQVLLENSFEDDEHKETFLKNVFNQIEKDGIQLTRHTLTSKVLERILPLLNAEQTKQFIILLMEDIELLCCDRFASHVLETVSTTVKSMFDNEEVLEQFVCMCKSIQKLCSKLIRDTYGCHVLSTILQVLSGVTVPESITKSRSARNSKNKKKGKGNKEKVDSSLDVSIASVPEIFEKPFKKLFKAIQNDSNFGELLCHRTASAVLQVLILVTGKTSKKRLGILCDEVISRARLFDGNSAGEDEEEDEETIHKLPVVMTDEIGSHLVEAIIQSADTDLFEQLSCKCFKRFAVSLCVHPVANYLVQTFLRSINSAEQAEFFVSKLIKFAEDILASGHMGCIVRIAETIARFELVTNQQLFLNAITEALHIEKNVDQKPLVKLILCLVTYDVFFKSDESDLKDSSKVAVPAVTKEMVNYHGVCILKACFQFKKCKTVVESFLELTPDEHLIVCSHQHGCIVYESFLQSQHVPLKKKNKLIDVLFSSMFVLACDKFGSRVVDSIWKTASEDMQMKIQSELRSHKSKLESDLYGRIILFNCGLNERVKKMNEITKTNEKKRKMLDDIIGPQHEELTKSVSDQPVVKKKKEKNDNRADKYREQLKLLGISFDSEVNSAVGEETKVLQDKPVTNTDDLPEIIQAIEATTKAKKERKKTKT